MLSACGEGGGCGLRGRCSSARHLPLGLCPHPFHHHLSYRVDVGRNQSANCGTWVTEGGTELHWQHLGLFFCCIKSGSKMLITQSVCLTTLLEYLRVSEGSPCGVRQSPVVRKPYLPLGSCWASICTTS